MLIAVQQQHSVTLGELAEDLAVSSVLECDENGIVPPRAVAFDSPSDVLHSGKYYIARRDVLADASENRVTFRGKIQVQEYELEHTITPSLQAVGAPTSRDLLATPSSSAIDKENPSTIRVLSLSSTVDRKRTRTEDELVNKNTAARLGDLTHLSNTRTDSKAAVRYTPFEADLDGSGTSVLVTLDTLRVLCQNLDAQEAHFAQKHNEAEGLLESARRVLFTSAK